MTPSPKSITQLLIEWRNGDETALDELMPLVHSKLHRMARNYMRGEHVGHTLQTTALVNELYLRLIDHKHMRWQNRAHFFAVAAQAMRRILIDHARARGATKRGGEAVRVSLDEAATLAAERSAELIALDEALDELAVFDERKSRVVELRYFGGLSVEETAHVLGVSAVTVLREWRAAKLWLLRSMS